MILGTNINKDFYIDRGADFEKIVEISVNFTDYDFVGYIKKNLTSPTAIPFEFYPVDNEPKKMRLYIAAAATVLLVSARNVYDIFATDPNTELSHKELAGTVFVSDTISTQPNPQVTPKYLELFLDRGADYDKEIDLTVDFADYIFNGYIKKTASDVDAVLITFEAIIDEPKKAKISISSGNTLLLNGPRCFFEIFATSIETNQTHKELGGPVFVQDSISFGTYLQPIPGADYHINVEVENIDGLGTAAAANIEDFASSTDIRFKRRSFAVYSLTWETIDLSLPWPHDIVDGHKVCIPFSTTGDRGIYIMDADGNLTLETEIFDGTYNESVLSSYDQYDGLGTQIYGGSIFYIHTTDSCSLVPVGQDLSDVINKSDRELLAMGPVARWSGGTLQRVSDDQDYITGADLSDYSLTSHDHDGTYQPAGDYATVSYADSLVIGLVDDRGSYDASTNQFPIAGGSGDYGVILKGDLWTLSVIASSGDLLGYPVGCLIRALSDNPGQTLSNWSIVEVGFGYVPENAANKLSSSAEIISNIDSQLKYPSIKALDEYLGTAATHDVSTGGNAGETDTGKVLEFGSGGSISANTAIIDAVQFDTLATPIANAEGLLQWNATDGTLDLGMSSGNITQQIGQEMFIKVHNDPGYETIYNGQVVYISGRTGVFPDVRKARSDIDSTSRAIGIATQDIASPAFGFVTTMGYVRGIKTDYTGTGIWGNTWVMGDMLYVSNISAGVLTNVEPSAPHHSDLVGSVGVISSNQGTILVGIDRHKTLEEMSDVNGTALTTTGQFPSWNQTSGYFDFDKNINDYASALGADDNYVTDAEKTNIGNLGTAAYTASTDYASALGADDNYVTDAEKSALHAAATVTGNGIAITGQQISLSIGTGSTQVAAGNHTHSGVYAASSHTHVSVDVTDASTGGNGATDSGKLVKFGGEGGGITFAGTNTFGVSGYSVNGNGVRASSSTGNALSAVASGNGVNYHATFGNSGDNRSFVARLLGALGWWRGAYTLMVSAVDTLTADRVQRFPDKDGTIALTSDITGTNSGTNTGNETAATIATALNAGTQDSTASDTDRIAVVHPAGGWMSLPTLWTWITGNINTLAKLDTIVTDATLARTDAGQTFAGEQAFSSTTRPTSSGTGTPVATSLMTLTDVETQLMSNDFVYVVDDFFGGGGPLVGVPAPGPLPWVLTTLIGTSAFRYGANTALNLPCPGGASIQTGTNNRDCGAVSFLPSFAGGGAITKEDFKSTTILKWRFYVQSAMGLRIGLGAIPVAPTFQSTRFIGLTGWEPATVWTASTAVSVGKYYRPATPNGRRYYASVAGTTAGTEPAWPTGAASTVTDGGVTWTEDGRDGNENFQYCTRDGTALTGTQTDSGIPYAVGWHTFTLRYLGSNNWGMSVDEASEATLNINVATLTILMQAQAYTTGQKHLLFDYFKFFQRVR